MVPDNKLFSLCRTKLPSPHCGIAVHRILEHCGSCRDTPNINLEDYSNNHGRQSWSVPTFLLRISPVSHVCGNPYSPPCLRGEHRESWSLCRECSLTKQCDRDTIAYSFIRSLVWGNSKQASFSTVLNSCGALGKSYLWQEKQSLLSTCPGVPPSVLLNSS